MNTLIKITYLVVFLMIIFFVLKEKQDDRNKGLSIEIAPNADGKVMVSSEDIKEDIFNDFQNDLEGVSMSDIDIDRLESVVKSNPFVKDCEVFIDNENVINIVASQNVPIARLVQKNGDIFISTSGDLLPMSSHFVPRVMVVSGLDEIDQKVNLDTVVFNEITQLYKVCKYIFDSNFLRSMIGQIDIDKNKKMILIPKIGNEIITLGESGNYVQNTSKIDIYYDYLLPTKGWGAISAADLSNDGIIGITK